jgi:hypothetical protein
LNAKLKIRWSSVRDWEGRGGEAEMFISNANFVSANLRHQICTI